MNTDILSLTKEELKELLSAQGEPAYRADQLFQWLHVKRASSYDEMRNLPGRIRESLAAKYPLPVLTVYKRLVSSDGTIKYLLACADGALIECVRMQYAHGDTLCISSQVGCRMGCIFCASGADGLTRNLTAGEMLSEILVTEAEEGEPVQNVVVMGTGEPLDNYDSLVRFLTLLKDADGRNLGGRHVTVSTCGLVPKIRALAKEHLTCGLALSLHAPNDEVRKMLLPAARAYSLDETIGAMREYAKESGRRVTFEYALCHGLNDSPEMADELAALLKGIPCLINLIPVNETPVHSLKRPTPAQAAAFKKRVEKCGYNVTIRKELGSDIDGACGQLRRRYLSVKNAREKT